ncbi:MAG TPA: S1/P1 nuclease [Thermoanaerobaculia bacterium]|nr:S1/P1 nuclease [Thermoanaerobaculia bacterium]
MSKRLLIALLLVCLCAPHAFAWGRSGHAIVARLAQDQLSSATNSKVRAILGARFLADFASEPDDWRKNNGAMITANWHFVNTPLDQASYDGARDCPDTQCVVQQVQEMLALLGDESQKNDVRREALIYLVHFVGDLHQPFHCGSGELGNGKSDLGGNLVHVTLNGRTDNLHHIWDGTLIESRGLMVRDYVERLENDTLGHRDKNELAGGTPDQWANESHEIAVREHVDDGATLGHDYIDRNVKVVDERLLLGGLRLARLIETALGGGN